MTSIADRYGAGNDAGPGIGDLPPNGPVGEQRDSTDRR
jgi:hypothetical protein